MNIFVYRKLFSSITSKTTLNLYYPRPHFFISLSHLNYFFSTKTQKPDPSTVEDCLINKHGFSPETASKLYTVITHARNRENCYSVITFLGENGFSTANIQNIVQQRPKVLAFDLDNIVKPKIKLFKDMGLSSDDIAQMITINPCILGTSADKRLLPSIASLKSILGTNLSVCKVLKKSGSGWLLNNDLEKTLIPNIEFLVSRGISRTHITEMVIRFPRLFLIKHDSIKDWVKRLEEFGFDRCSSMFFHALRYLSAMSNEKWEKKLELFRSFGYSEDQILFMFKKAPQVFAISDHKLRDVTEFLLSTGRCDIMFFAHSPELLGYSFEGRIKPRLKILEILERKDLVKTKPTLTTLLKLSDKDFSKKYASLCEDEASKIFPLATMARN